MLVNGNAVVNHQSNVSGAKCTPLLLFMSLWLRTVCLVCSSVACCTSVRSHGFDVFCANLLILFVSYLQLGRTALIEASKGGWVEICRLLLEKEADVNLGEKVSRQMLQLLTAAGCAKDGV